MVCKDQNENKHFRANKVSLYVSDAITVKILGLIKSYKLAKTNFFSITSPSFVVILLDSMKNG